MDPARPFVRVLRGRGLAAAAARVGAVRGVGAALRLRREFTGAGFAWSEECDRGDVVAFRRDRVLVVVNTGRVAVPLPAGEVVLASQPLCGGCLPPDAAVWLRLS